MTKMNIENLSEETLIFNVSSLEVQKEEEVPDLGSIQQEVIELLGEIGTLIESTKRNALPGNEKQKDEGFERQFKTARDNVAQLELRMAIIAPMKAGKSTIINAIAGQDLLPSCATAMTTIPTEIVFVNGLTEPILTLEDKTLELFRKIQITIKQKIEKVGIAELEKDLARYPHLIYLLTEIEQATNFPFEGKIEGKKAIDRALNFCNQIIRLYSAIDPLAEPLANLKIIPRIETPFLGMAGIEGAKNVGNLVIIDTPGPNEASANLKLTGVVEEQLSRCSIILLVLDYTQLNNEAAEAIKKQIQPILKIIGQENIYILVNKIDQRRKGDITTEQVKNFVLADLELDAEGAEYRIFEISAIRAAAATQYLLEIEQKPKAKLLELNSLETLAQEVFGIDWDEEIEDITTKILTKKARKLWVKSGFAPFLQNAIAKLLEGAAPLSLITALNLSRQCLIELRDDINLKGKAISKSKGKLKAEITALEADLASLESCRQNLKQIDTIKQELRDKLESIINELKVRVKVNLETYFAEQEYEQGDIIKKADIKTREILLTNIGDFELLPKFLSKNITSNLEPKTTGVITFSTPREADKFTQKALIYAKQRLEKILLSSREKIDIEVVATNRKLNSLLKRETQPIVERTRERLQTSFEIQLELKSPVLETEEDLSMEACLVQKKSHLVISGYEEKLVKKRAWYYWFGLVPFYSQEISKRPYKKENYYAVSVYDLVENINKANESFIEDIKQKLITYLEEEIELEVDDFFGNLDAYFARYIDNIEQVQKNKELSIEQRTKLIKVLYCSVSETTKYIKKTDSYLESIADLLPSS